MPLAQTSTSRWISTEKAGISGEAIPGYSWDKQQPVLS